MKDFPLDRYRFYVANDKVIAVSTYCGHNVRGIAKCSSQDEFDIEKGKQLAAARCNQKIAEKRVVRAKRKYSEAIGLCNDAEHYLNKMFSYKHDANEALAKANHRIEELLKEY